MALRPRDMRHRSEFARTTPRVRSGFTVVELVATLVVAGVLAATALPRFVRVQDFSERFFYDDVTSGLRYAQKLAIATGCPVQFDFTGGGYAVTQRTGCTAGAWTQPVHHPSTGTVGFSETTPTGVAVASTVDPLIFDALGRAVDGVGTPVDANVTVGARSIAVVGNTGYVDGG